MCLSALQSASLKDRKELIREHLHLIEFTRLAVMPDKLIEKLYHGILIAGLCSLRQFTQHVFLGLFIVTRGKQPVYFGKYLIHVHITHPPYGRMITEIIIHKIRSKLDEKRASANNTDAPYNKLLCFRYRLTGTSSVRQPYQVLPRED